MARRRFLVTGGTGFIGSSLVRSLLERGHYVRVLDNNSRGSLGRLSDISADIDFVEADIRDADSVLRACESMDAVFHLAYINGTEYFYTKPALVLEVGVKGMLNVLDGCRATNIRELILMSSSEVYQTPPLIPTPETVPLIVPDPLEARYSYGGGKIISELLTINYGRQDFSQVRIVRPHNVYGPDMGFEHVIPQFVRRLHELSPTVAGTDSLPFPIQGTGKETRSFIFIDDFIRGVHLVLDHGKHLEIYHVGSETESSISDVAHCVARSMGIPIQVQAGDLLPGSTLRRCPDITKVKQLGFQPKISLAEGVDRYVDWYRSEGF